MPGSESQRRPLARATVRPAADAPKSVEGPVQLARVREKIDVVIATTVATNVQDSGATLRSTCERPEQSTFASDGAVKTTT